MTRRSISWLAWGLGVFSFLLGAMSVVLYTLNNGLTGLASPTTSFGDASIGIAFPLVGALIASRRPENAVGWLLIVCGLFQGTSAFTNQYAIYALVTNPNVLPQGTIANWMETWVWLPGFALTATFLLLLFPNGHLPSGRWRPVTWVSAAVITIGPVSMMLVPWKDVQAPVPGENPIGIPGSEKIFEALIFGSFLVGIVVGTLSLISLILRFHRSTGQERRQLEWFVYGGVIFVIGILAGIPFQNTSTAATIDNWAQGITPYVMAAAIGIAILRYRLYDIDRIINRTLVYLLLTASLAATYVVGILVLQYLFSPITQRSDIAIALSTLAV
ncbi:MAG TPA: hypothetical protein VKU87_01620, partial [Thermomicrobiaceae bacterium]|nr:hypothetical protein [Thermomicrobiaceae bacterium]